MIQSPTALHERRHSLAHLLAAAVLELYPDAEHSIGPAIDDGFYYDILFKTPITNVDLPHIEKRMKEILSTWKTPTLQEISSEQAKKMYENNQFKAELIHDIISRGEKITTVTFGNFTDLCEGGHVADISIVDPESFCLTTTAGAYWRGDENLQQLTRIYGYAFNTKEELTQYITQKEEAKKRDHRIIGKQLGLFFFSDLVGPGLPLWTPKGTLLRHTLDNYVWQLRKKAGFERVSVPHLTKTNLYKKSGHWDKYAEDLFKVHTRDDKVYCIKPMNCPHHTQIFSSELRSYRDLPQRYAETTMVYRDEQSGELAGLTRVLSITQDDAHIFCREKQLSEEVNTTIALIQEFYTTLGFTSLTPRFSRRDMGTPEKYLGSPEDWDKGENVIRTILDRDWNGIWVDGEGEAAFYGAKIDFLAMDALGRKHQVATIQIDFVQPKNLECTYINEEGKKENVVMIHCAIMGSIERFIATYLEHTGGRMPFWLAPEQLRVLTIGDIGEYKNSIENILTKIIFEKPLTHNILRYSIDATKESVGKKIHNAQTEHIPMLLIVGGKDAAAGTITIQYEDKKEVIELKALELYLSSITV